MSIKQTKDGWRVDFRAGGAGGKRYRKTCRTKAEAERYQKFVEAQLIALNKPWNEKPTDNRTLTELIAVWYRLLGQQLRYNTRRLQKLNNAAKGLGDPIARKLTASDYGNYRASRLDKGRAIKTVNEEQKFIGTVYNSLEKLGEIDYPNPIKHLELIHQQEREMHFLEHSQITELLHALKNSKDPQVELVSLLCLETGARWGEAENLTSSRVRNHKVTYTETKGGKNRTIPISDRLFARLTEQAKTGGRLFTPCAQSFYDALETTTIQLPKHQKTHVLRHTFASHFMINGGNILTLQSILGHADIKMTLRYAHLAPDHLTDALKFNPLADMVI
tara:strand:- start:112 stop:1110 length:999 start_codon:yes stop_codon:yes gene_type:complete